MVKKRYFDIDIEFPLCIYITKIRRTDEDKGTQKVESLNESSALPKQVIHIYEWIKKKNVISY